MAIATSALWADKPWDLIETPSKSRDIKGHPAHYIANEVAFAHNAMLRGLNALHNQAPHVPEANVADFMFFAKSWSNWVIHHNKIQEQALFPLFESVYGVVPGSLQRNVEQHEVFADSLAAFNEYASKTVPTEYGSGTFLRLLKLFAAPMRAHFADEIETLWAMESVENNSVHSQKLLDVFRKCETGMEEKNKYIMRPMILGLSDKTFQGGNAWPKMPHGSAHLVHHLLERKHRGAWRFLPCTTWRKPRKLEFVGEQETIEQKETEQQSVEQQTTEQQTTGQQPTEQGMRDRETSKPETIEEEITEEVEHEIIRQETISQRSEENEIVEQNTTEQKIIGQENAKEQKAKEQEAIEGETTAQKTTERDTTEQEVPNKQDAKKDQTSKQETIEQETTQDEITQDNTTEQETTERETIVQEVPDQPVAKKDPTLEQEAEEKITEHGTTEHGTSEEVIAVQNTGGQESSSQSETKQNTADKSTEKGTRNQE